MKFKLFFLMVFIAAIFVSCRSDSGLLYKLPQIADDYETLINFREQKHRSWNVISIGNFVSGEYFLGKKSPSHIGLRISHMIHSLECEAITVQLKTGAEGYRPWIALWREKPGSGFVLKTDKEAKVPDAKIVELKHAVVEVKLGSGKDATEFKVDGYYSSAELSGSISSIRERYIKK